MVFDSFLIKCTLRIFTIGLVLGSVSAFADKKLAESTYVSSKAYRLTSATVLWVNPDFAKLMNDAEVLKNFAWGIPSKEHPKSVFGREYVVVRADRYGGSGMGTNWGSGRAAEISIRTKNGVLRFQIKGIGVTRLVGETTREDHSNGTAPMEEGMREAIWGEINQSAPFGANRVIAVIDRGTWTLQPNGTYQRDVLIIREPSIRPAHFMRTQHGVGEWEDSDVARVKDNLKLFADALPKPPGFPNNATEAEQIKAGLTEYVHRIARQYAYLNANRLFHGAPSPSNIELSGRLIDYGTQTSQPGYGQLKVLDHSDPSGVNDDIIRAQVTEFISSIRRSFKEIESHIPSTREMADLFRTEYQTGLRSEYLGLMGVAREDYAALLNETEVLSFVDDVIELSKRGGIKAAARYFVTDKTQKYEVGALLAELSRTVGEDGTIGEAGKAVLSKRLPGLTLYFARGAFHKKYETTMKLAFSLAEKRGISRSETRELLQHTATIKNTKQPLLYRWKLMDQNFEAIKAYGKTGNPKLIRDQIERVLSGSDATQTVSDASPPLQISPSVGNSVIVTDPGIRSGFGMAPNEFRHDFFHHQVVGKTGAYAGVGLYRIWNTAIRGGSPLAIIIDYDADVCDLAAIHREWALKIQNRRAFLMTTLLGGVPADMEKWLNRAESERDFLAELAAAAKKSGYRLQDDASAGLSSENESRLKELVKRGSYQAFIQDMLDPGNKWGYAALDRFLINDTWKISVLGSDLLFDQLRIMAASDRLPIIQGSLISEVTYAALDKILSQHDLKISELDVSNADSHIEKFFGKQGLQTLTDLIEKLPWDPKGSVFSTTKTREASFGAFGLSRNREADHWYYLDHSVSGYVEGVRSALRQDGGLREMLKPAPGFEQWNLQIEDQAKILSFQKEVLSRPVAIGTQKIIWVTGTMGSGKSYSVNELSRQGGFDLKDFVVLDADDLTAKLPSYIRSDSAVDAADALHFAAVKAIWDMTEKAIRGKKSIIFYSSIRAHDATFSQLREMQRLAPDAHYIWMKVDVATETALYRNDRRARMGGHYVDPDRISDGARKAEEVEQAIEDFFQTKVIVSNAAHPEIVAIRTEKEWTGIEGESISPKSLPEIFNRTASRSGTIQYPDLSAREKHLLKCRCTLVNSAACSFDP